jgi:hypothetical protein
MLSLRASHDRVFSDESIPVLEEERNRLETVGDETGVGVFWKGRHLRDGLLAGQANPSWRALTMTCDRSRAPNLEKM